MKQKIKDFLSKLKFWKKKSELKTIKFESSKPQIPTSQPYIVSVTNTTDETKDFELFGAATNLAKVNSKGEIEQNGVVIKDCFIEGNYSYLLYLSMFSPFDVALTYLMFTGNEIDLFLKSVMLSHRHPNGRQSEKRIKFFLDPFQQQTRIIANYEKIDIDGFTKIIGNIPPRETFIFHFYPINQD